VVVEFFAMNKSLKELASASPENFDPKVVWHTDIDARALHENISDVVKGFRVAEAGYEFDEV